jgi:hypothetical protein
MSQAKALQVFNRATNPAQIDESSWFSGADFLVINPIGYGADQFEIAAVLTIEAVADTAYLNGFVEVPQVSFGEKEIPLGIDYLDSAVIVPLPDEVTRSQCRCKVCLSTSYAVTLEIYAFSRKTACDCKAELDKIQGDLNYLKVINTAIGINQIAQDAVLLGLSTVVGAGLALPTGGTSTLLPPATAATLAPATTALATALTLVSVLVR